MRDFSHFPVLETENLILRQFFLSDAQDLFEMRSNEKMHQYTDTVPDKDIEDTQVYIKKMLKGLDENQWIIWGIEHKISKKLIGTAGIWNFDQDKNCAELAYGITSNEQGKGYMKEALDVVSVYGVKVLGLKWLDAYTEIENKPSRRLLEKCGFTEVGAVDDAGYFSDRIYHMIIYRMTSHDI